MSDPFELLRGLEADAEPDLAAIRARARRIQGRRYAVMASVAGLLVVGAASALVLRPGRETEPVSGRALRPVGTPLTAFAEGGQAASGQMAPASQAPATPAPLRSPRLEAGRGAAVTVPSAPAPAGAEALRLEISVSPQTIGVGQSAEVRLRVCNDSGRTARVTFPTSQLYDIEVRRGGAAVWRWSAGQAFAQVISEREFVPGCRDLATERWGATRDDGRPAEPGRYTVVGILVSSPRVESPPATLCVVACV